MRTHSLSETPSPRRRRRRGPNKRTFLLARVRSLLWPDSVGLGHKLGTWFLVGVLAYMSVQAGALGLAHLQVIRVEKQLKYWYKKGDVPSPAALASALRAIEQANYLHPDNPYQLTLQARLLEWRAYNGGDVIREDYRRALFLYQRAASLRPLWPDSWAEMAQIKVRLNEFDAGLNHYLTRAAQLGPYTPAVHIVIAQANLGRLSSLPSDQRVLSEVHTLRGIQDRRSTNRVQALVRQFGQERVLCQWLESAEAQSDNPPELPGLCGP